MGLNRVCVLLQSRAINANLDRRFGCEVRLFSVQSFVSDSSKSTYEPELYPTHHGLGRVPLSGRRGGEFICVRWFMFLHTDAGSRFRYNLPNSGEDRHAPNYAAQIGNRS